MCLSKQCELVTSRFMKLYPDPLRKALRPKIKMRPPVWETLRKQNREMWNCRDKKAF